MAVSTPVAKVAAMKPDLDLYLIVSLLISGYAL